MAQDRSSEDSAVGAAVGDVEARLERLESRLADLEEDFAAKLTDVRERVIQVKRETDEKAPADHDHDESTDNADFEDALDDLEARTDESVEALEATVEDLESRVTEFDGKLDRLARAAVSMKRRLADLSGDGGDRERLAALAAEANREGVNRARCGACAKPVRVSLLVAPRCPHCEAAFTGIEPSGGWFFGSDTLRTDRRPALTGEVADGENAPPKASPEADLEDVEGVGSAYASRLRSAGFDSLEALARADPDAVASSVDVSPKRTADWVEQARGLAGDCR